MPRARNAVARWLLAPPTRQPWWLRLLMALVMASLVVSLARKRGLVIGGVALVTFGRMAAEVLGAKLPAGRWSFAVDAAAALPIPFLALAYLTSWTLGSLLLGTLAFWAAMAAAIAIAVRRRRST